MAQQPRPVIARVLRERVVAAQPESAEKGYIAQLQEFVQGSKENPMPANCSILQWDDCDQRMVSASLEFRAKVAFILDGIPHHALGTWQTSKMQAKRDVAERALFLFVTRWGSLAPDRCSAHEPDSNSMPQSAQSDEAQDVIAMEAAASVEEAQALDRFCCAPPSPGQPPLVTSNAPPRWIHSAEGGAFKAFVEIDLLGVPHMFPGRWKASLAEACQDAARRVLWYLGCPGFERSFEPVLGTDKAPEMNEPPANWKKDPALQEDNGQDAAEKKTVLMRLQNRLQQTYARQIEVGKSAICWSYERAGSDHGRAPLQGPLVRATAYIPAADRSFTGDWQPVQREAQIDTCHAVSKFLDIAFPSPILRVRARTH